MINSSKQYSTGCYQLHGFSPAVILLSADVTVQKNQENKTQGDLNLLRTIYFLINCSKLMDMMMDLIKKTAGYKETGDDYTLDDFEEEELLDD